MRYLGGKAKIAKPLAAAIRANTDAVKLWEPFCGGLNATKELVKVFDAVYCTDANAALISMYTAYRQGWRPPTSTTRDGHKAAKVLPDTDPLKAFYGFGMSFGGAWFCGYTGDRYRRPSGRVRDRLEEAVRGLAPALAPADVQYMSFLDQTPMHYPGVAIYCDPPYAGTSGYSTGAFDHAWFWALCRGWQACGVDVFVSEYTAPAGVPVIWSCVKRSCVARKAESRTVRTENLYLLQGHH